MSKWTLEKILACEEIKPGTIFHFLDEEKRVVVKKTNETLFTVNSDCFSLEITSWTSEDFDEFTRAKFYLCDGTEILPPKDKKKIKVEAWVNVYPDGQQAAYSSKWAANSTAFPDRLVCEYLEKEVEVDCE